MCAFLKDNKPQVADKDIEVYKMVLEHNGKFYAPIRGTLYESNDLSSEFGEVYESDYRNPMNNIPLFCIDKGIYSYSILEDANTLLYDFQVMGGSFLKYRIIKAIIPKGTEYYAGFESFCCNTPLLVSKRLIMDFENIVIIKASLPYDASDILNEQLLTQLKQIVNNHVHSNT